MLFGASIAPNELTNVCKIGCREGKILFSWLADCFVLNIFSRKLDSAECFVIRGLICMLKSVKGLVEERHCATTRESRFSPRISGGTACLRKAEAHMMTKMYLKKKVPTHI